jgi:lipoprotein-anchoring transpeptidase ErfK/SrfK
LPKILFVMVLAVTLILAFLQSEEKDEIAISNSEITATQKPTETPTPKPTPKPTATPRQAYIPDPENLKAIPDIGNLDLIKDNITSVQNMIIKWEVVESADYYLLCILDDDNNIVQKEILWANITQWEIANFEGKSFLLLSYKDMGKDQASDDKLISSYILQIESEDDEMQELRLEVTPEERYYILVDKEDFSFSIFTYDENMEYTNVIATYPCALGRSARMTPVGKFEISSKGDWKTWQTGEFSPYYTRYTSGLYIHGSLYSKKSYDTMIADYYQRIGTKHTGGCIRTTLEASRWIYYNCPAGTVVEIVASSDLVPHVEQPEIDSENPTWDPTDPNKPSE